MGLGDSNRAACEALAATPGSEFQVLHAFLPCVAAERMLALEAMFRSLRDIPLTVSDPAVGLAKLAWWQQEFTAARDSQHPVLRALVETGALELLDRTELNVYLQELAALFREESLESIDRLRDDLRRTAGREAALLAAGSGVSRERLAAAAAAHRLLELIRTLARPVGRFEWLPLDLVARHGFRPASESPVPSRAGLVRDLAHAAMSWREETALSIDTCDTEGAAFIALRDRLTARRLARVARRPQSVLVQSQRATPGDVFAAWRSARRLAPVLRGAS